jgi:molecular chaperone Hsp33
VDQLVRGLLLPGAGARIVAALTTAACREAAARHDASPAAALALARATSAAVLLATLTKGGERVTLQVMGDGPLRGVTVEADAAGQVRGFPHAPRAAGALGGPSRARLGPLLGAGIVNVIRDLGLKERYQGSTPLISGEIDEDVEQYLTGSEQVVSALGCDAVLGPEGEIAAAGGVLVQCLPGGDVDAVADARVRLRRGGLLASLRSGAESASGLAARALEVDPKIIDLRPVRYLCPCSRERVSGALALLGADELRAMLVEDGGAEVTCGFCGARYGLGAGELERLLAQAMNRPGSA